MQSAGSSSACTDVRPGGKQRCAPTETPLHHPIAPGAHCRYHSPCVMHTVPVHAASSAPAAQHTNHGPFPTHPCLCISRHIQRTSISALLPQVPASLTSTALLSIPPSPPSSLAPHHSGAAVQVPAPPASNPDGSHPVRASRLTSQRRSETTRPLSPHHGRDSHPPAEPPLPARLPPGHPPVPCRSAAHSLPRPAW